MMHLGKYLGQSSVFLELQRNPYSTRFIPGSHGIYTHISVPCRPISPGIYTRVFFFGKESMGMRGRLRNALWPAWVLAGKPGRRYRRREDSPRRCGGTVTDARHPSLPLPGTLGTGCPIRQGTGRHHAWYDLPTPTRQPPPHKPWARDDPYRGGRHALLR